LDNLDKVFQDALEQAGTYEAIVKAMSLVFPTLILEAVHVDCQVAFEDGHAKWTVTIKGESEARG
jgi:hypothetical protein